MDLQTQGARIRALLESAEGGVVIIAPFIKVNALRTLVEVIPVKAHLRCVTRWLPREVAAGVSDPEILDLLEGRGNTSLSLVDRLHAKIFIAGDRCLVGSSNVTLAGLGEGGEAGNIEVLVEASLSEPGVARTLEEIVQDERVATRSMARAVRRMAERLTTATVLPDAIETQWFPGSRHPERAYGMYILPKTGFLVQADRNLEADLARSNLPPGLEEEEFREEIRALLGAIPPAKELLAVTEDKTLTRADANSWLETMSGNDFTPVDLWTAFVNWMAYFYSDCVVKQEISEIALRRARLLG